jgi:hypothetical protein
MMGESSVRMGWKLLPARRSLLVLAVLAIGLIAALANATNALALSPSVSTLAAANVAETTVTLNGSVNPNSLETKTYFEYGATTSYGSKTAEVNVGSGASTLEQAQAVTGLTANTTYHYRIVASNFSGTSQGADRTFTVGWVVQAAPSAIGNDISCTSPTACTVVAGGSIQRWNGSEWSSQSLAVPAGGSGVKADSVSCSSSSACTAVGSYLNGSGESKVLAEFWNGSEWKVQSSPTPTSATGIQVRGISCLSASECSAVGTYGVTTTFGLRWNGSEWSLQTTKNPTTETYLTSISCVSSSFCMATGYYYDSVSASWIALAERWDGSEWSVKTVAKPAGSTRTWFFGVSCTSSSACTAIGDKEGAERQPMAQRWNGTEWSLQTTPTIKSFQSAVDIVCPSSTACTAIAYGLDGGSVDIPIALRWSGSEWTKQSLPLPAGALNSIPNSLSCVVSRGCMMVGQYSYWNGSTVIAPLAVSNWRSAAPTTTTNAASGVAEKEATLNGTVNPNGTETKAFFEYGTTTSYGTKTAEVNLGSGTSAVEKSAAVSGLSPNTTYHYRIVANNENPEMGKGEDKTFTTTGPPSVITEAAVPNTTTGEAATLKASVDPNGQSTTYQFEYGTSSGVYTKTVPEPAESAGSGMEPKSVSYEITGLTRGTKYYFRVSATNAGGKVYGSELSFTTPTKPTATTLAASGIGKTSATLNGSVTPNGVATKYQFEYGTTISYGSKAPASPKEIGSGSSPVSVEQPISGLGVGTLYHYRVVAENAFGTTFGADETFTTAPESAEETVLCTEKSLSCPGGKTDGVGTEIKTSLVSGTKSILTNSFKNIECNKSSINAKVTSTGKTIGASIETLTFEECNCEVKAIKKGTLELKHIESTENATVTSAGTEVTTSCSTIFGTVHCIYATEGGTDLGPLEGGNPAKIKISKVNIPRLSTSAFCIEKGEWDAEYEVTSPKPLYIEP